MTATARPLVPSAAPVPSAPGELLVAASELRRRVAAVEVVIPVYNEQAGLVASIERLHAYLDERFPLPWLVTIVDNASTDATWGLACKLARSIDGVQALRLPLKGRGRALRAAWSASPAPVVAYMDVDLSTDLDALLPLVAPLLSGHSDIAIGTRLASSSRVVRGPKREAISRTYNLILRTALRSGFSDAQCGFKAARSDVARALLPLVEDEGWFFDTELLVLAEHNGLRIHEVPVDWVDDPDSRVDIVQTATDDLKGVGRLLNRFAHGQGRIAAADRAGLAGLHPLPDELGGQLVRFASVGLASTVVFGVLFAALLPALGAVAADLLALALCSVANTAAHRHLTFADQGDARRPHRRLGGLALAALPLALNLGALAAADALGWGSTLGLVAALTVGNALAAGGRFVLLRRRFGGEAEPTVAAPAAAGTVDLTLVEGER
ncbi:glycosyltransferase family 2 protein [Aquihabitans sp. G128]|uniref:dolichyl-phosphate beta-glucosyltransferase n=1 Tax=Aquihabitans sp. G128 TaxID=2849779 RepID=UPI001C24AA1D|nr:dolichyl-phosphate beta-glucosyltransferase [Aquihabitans sp. G128]QXC61027.1 glycosyltransferase family 2 protein [Aquihabitans sp. G128]